VLAGTGPRVGIEVTDPDPAWPRQFYGLASRIQEALGWRVLQMEHVGSTAVGGLAAKPIIDIDLTALKLTLRIAPGATSTRSADNTGVRAQVLRRHSDGSWLRIMDRPEVPQS
jgi:GrpB-like predicted nucleotidyltransferase (UPF0157 family)